MKQRGSRHLDGELTWYFTDRDGDLGRRGMSLEPQVRGARDSEPSDRQMFASALAGRIEAALHTLPHATQRVLRDAHTPLLPGVRAELAPLGDMAGVIVRDPATDPVKLASALRTARSRAKGDREARESAAAEIARLRVAAGSAVAEALRVYREAWGADRRRDRQVVDARREARTRARFEDRHSDAEIRVFGSVIA